MASGAEASDQIGLVIGNSDYASLPDASSCAASSERVGSALRRIGVRVLEHTDSTSGGVQGAMDRFLGLLEAAPGASAIVYFCGYAAGHNDRTFLLPVSAAITRPADIMTQGFLAKALLDLLERGKAGRGLVMLDLMPAPGLPAPALATLSALAMPEQGGLVAATGVLSEPGPSPLAVAIATGLERPDIAVADLLTHAERALAAAAPTRIGALRRPERSLPVAGEPPAATPAPPAAARPETASTGPEAVPAAAPEGGVVLPDEAEMNPAQRQLVQEALGRIGYYEGAIDGIFGPETRAAIRRFQHEIGAEMTGTITGDQASRLADSE